MRESRGAGSVIIDTRFQSPSSSSGGRSCLQIGEWHLHVFLDLLKLTRSQVDVQGARRGGDIVRVTLSIEKVGWAVSICEERFELTSTLKRGSRYGGRQCRGLGGVR